MSTTTASSASASDVATPRARRGLFTKLLSGRRFPGFVARGGAAFGSLLGRPFRVFGAFVAARHADVLDLLARDLEFRIAPVNEARIDAVNGGPFVLGMDRGARLAREREALYRALAQVDLAALEHGANVEAERSISSTGMSAPT